MKEISDVSCLVVDSGLFLPFARRMAEQCKRVIFYNPDRRAFPSLKQGCVGDGFPDIEHTLDFWAVLPEADVVCFPDIGHSGLQRHLKKMDVPVWGSVSGDIIEINRKYFLSLLKDIELDVPEFTSVTGVDALADHLCDKEDQYIKISRWRGDMETTHWRNWNQDSGWLDWMAVNLGPLKDRMPFLVFPKIDTDLEIGCDTYFIGDDFPNPMLGGIEAKDSCYFGAVRQRDDMPEQIKDVLAAVTPFLSQHKYRNQISFELRVKGGHAFYIDATQRAGMPSSASQQLLWSNFADIVWSGAHGILIDPIPDDQFSIECMVTCKTGKDCWDVVELPKRLDRNVRFSNCAFVDGCYAFPPDEFHSGELGWLCATGNTPTTALQEAKALADQLPDGLQANVEQMVELIKEVESAHKADIPITDKPMPAISEVVEA